ncbi:SDR family oxidoreductase [Agromyces mangrovi Wang et al. 2018]|uniref:SDR family oxidoreductase n=1 Tax=Agromyces mangrovi TaxID=1858653 RepID=UPI002572DB2D|nr:SDR family oxidoreductase [Agromyces mangrovi]
MERDRERLRARHDPDRDERLRRPRGEARERTLDQLSIRRWGEPDDIARLLVFLASDEAAYITGTLVDTSGGKFATQSPGRAYDAAAGDTTAPPARRKD